MPSFISSIFHLWCWLSRKVWRYFYFLTIHLNLSLSRILLACIKYLGEFPCPRCLIPKCRVPDLGTKNDKKRRETLARVDNEDQRNTVELARERIYKDGASINSKSIKDLLGPQSLTPTRVSVLVSFIWLELIIWLFRTHFQSNFPHMASTTTACSCLTSSMNLNLGSGKQLLHILCEYCMRKVEMGLPNWTWGKQFFFHFFELCV